MTAAQTASDMFWQAFFTCVATSVTVIAGQIVMAYRAKLEAEKTRQEVAKVGNVAETIKKNVAYNTEITARNEQSAIAARDAAQNAHDALVAMVEKHETK